MNEIQKKLFFLLNKMLSYRINHIREMASANKIKITLYIEIWEKSEFDNQIHPNNILVIKYLLNLNHNQKVVWLIRSILFLQQKKDFLTYWKSSDFILKAYLSMNRKYNIRSSNII